MWIEERGETWELGGFKDWEVKFDQKKKKGLGSERLFGSMGLLVK